MSDFLLHLGWVRREVERERCARLADLVEAKAAREGWDAATAAHIARLIREEKSND